MKEEGKLWIVFSPKAGRKERAVRGEGGRERGGKGREGEYLTREKLYKIHPSRNLGTQCTLQGMAQ